MNKSESHYTGAFIFAAVSLVLGGIIGWYEGGTVGAAITALFSVLVLSVMEVSLSFDNAVVNAKVLRGWDEKWLNRFLTWGMVVAVFGMRLVFPIAIVAAIGMINPVDVVVMALTNPHEYARHLTAIHHEIAGFGGAFLLMVALGFFFEQKHVYWLEWIETKLTNLGQIEGVAAAITILTVWLIGKFAIGGEPGSQFAWAGVFGVVTFVIVHGIAAMMKSDDDEEEEEESSVTPLTAGAPPKVTQSVIKAGIGGFIYLEVLDASFSFDGVIGAFAITFYLPIIALGLGVGAMFVRSMTKHLVQTDKLSEYRYLEHGAFYAILVLAGLMFTSATGHEVPEWVTGLLGASIIGVAFLHSRHANKQDDKETAATSVTA